MWAKYQLEWASLARTCRNHMYIDNEKLLAIEGNQMPNNVFPFSQETKADHQVLGQYQRYYSGQTRL